VKTQFVSIGRNLRRRKRASLCLTTEYAFGCIEHADMFLRAPLVAVPGHSKHSAAVAVGVGYNKVGVLG
jgi:hypothetical protein